MANVYFRRLCETAKSPLPVKGQTGCFQLFTAFPICVDPGHTVAVDVGLLIKVVDGYYPMIVCDQTSLARKLLVNSFNTLAEADNMNKDNPVCKLEFTVCNTGPIQVLLEAGYPVARLVLVRVDAIQLVECDAFPDDPNFKREKTVDIASVAKTDAVWFKRQYKQDMNKCFTQFFDTLEGRKYWTQIEQMRETNEYKNSRDKSLFEAKWVYENLPDDIRNNVVEQFNNYKKEFINQTRKS
jgi:dUTPase